jgi:tetratricopeptide (TPR) repeat protein
VSLLGGAARADAVDDAFARGHAAAAEEHWADALAAWKEAARLLPAPSGELEFALGTAYAHTGELGRATFHLRRSMDPRLLPDAARVEAARANLQEVRRRAELEAAASGAQMDRAAGWWDLALDALRASWLGWIALLGGALALLAGAVLRRGAAGVRSAPLVAGTAWVALAAWAGIGGLHGIALRADRVAPQAIVLPQRVEVRERPGAHAKSSFTVQGGARLRLVERSPGWRRIRLPGGLEGWVPETEVSELDAWTPVP